MIRISAVSYLNTKPFIYGLLKNSIAKDIDLNLDIPAMCAQKLKAGTIDLALTPVAILPELNEWHLVSDFCIGADGKVDTVCIYSDVPIEKAKAIYLDFHSRSSAALTRVLCRDYWQIEPTFLKSQEGYQQQIKGSTAGLIIGDRAIGQDKNYAYCYDLADIWKQWTGLPFVFAAWISTKPLPAPFVKRFNNALAAGLELLPELIKILPTVKGFDLEHYFKTSISYSLDNPKKEALSKFLSILKEFEAQPLT